MQYSIKEQADIQAVVIKTSGIINTDEAEKMVVDAGIAIRNSGFKRCLVDLTETEIDPGQTMTEMFMFVDVIKKAGIDKSVKIASLYTSGVEHRRLLEKSANFEGFLLKGFFDRDDALSWLMQ